MGKPSDEFLPGCAEHVPTFFRQSEAVQLVFVEHAVKFLCAAWVDDDGVVFVVEPQAAGVEVGAADGAETAVNRNDFRVMKSRFVYPDFHAVFHQAVDVVEHAVGRKWDVAVCRDHDFHFHSSLDRLAQCPFQFSVEREVGVDNLDAVLCDVDGFEIEFPDNLVRGERFAIDDAHHFPSCRAACVGFQSFEVVGSVFASEILRSVDVLAADFIPYPQEYLLQGVDLVAVDAAVHVAPFSHHFRTFYIIVSHVHAAGVGNLSVNHDDFPVVA